MKYVYAILTFTLFGCAGSMINPYITDIYGNRVNLIQRGSVLISVDRDPTNPDIFYLRFYENVLLAGGKVPIERKKTMNAYLKQVTEEYGYVGYIGIDVELSTGWMDSYIYTFRFVKTEEEFDKWIKRMKK